jgi:hypothetical protein
VRVISNLEKDKRYKTGLEIASTRKSDKLVNPKSKVCSMKSQVLNIHWGNGVGVNILFENIFLDTVCEALQFALRFN